MATIRPFRPGNGRGGNLLKARNKSREISKEQMIEEKESTEKKIQALSANIRIVESFIFRS